jgi:hypothetical protein
MDLKDTTTAHESEVTRADALLLFKLINDEAVSEDARRRIDERNEREKRIRADVKGAATRRKK